MGVVMEHEWIVEVTDHTGAPLTAATVALVQSSALAGKQWPFAAVAATHVHDGGATYKAASPIVPVPGAWTLIVRVHGKSPVVQPLKMRATAKTEVATAPAPKLAATVRFSAEVKTVGAVRVRRTRFDVKMFPASELVFLSGTEFFQAGTRFRIFAENYRAGLRREKLVDDGVIGTLFSTDDRSHETHVPAMAGGWLKVGHRSFGPTAGITPGKKHTAVVGEDVSIVDMYKYLSSVGASEPGRVKEVGIFSHSFREGPILFNTGDNDSIRARESTDFDGRPKDFNSTNTRGWPNMKAAMAPGGSWHVWGCSAATHFKNLAVAAHRHRDAGDDAFFTVHSTMKHHDGGVSEIVAERTTRTRIRSRMDERFRSTSYMAAAAAHLGVPVFGAPPGVGSSFDQQRNLMFINVVAYADVFAYFKEQFGPEFTPTSGTYDRGYVDYHALGKRAVPARAAFSSEWYSLSRDFDFGTSTLTVEAGPYAEIDGTDVVLKVTAKSDFATMGLKGHQYELHSTKDEKLSLAIYVQEDRQAFNVGRDAKGKFTVLGTKR